jgi:hypothetical protein
MIMVVSQDDVLLIKEMLQEEACYELGKVVPNPQVNILNQQVWSE